jgi:hypothetical protein
MQHLDLNNQFLIFIIFDSHLVYYLITVAHFLILLQVLERGVKTTSVTFITRALPCFSNLYSLYYANKAKGIPANTYELLTPVALAHWIMGDGSLKSQGLLLCTDSNTIQDVVRLMNVLTIRYDLKCTMHNSNPGQYRIYISRKSMPKLISIVKPHMAPCMLFKLGL